MERATALRIGIGAVVCTCIVLLGLVLNSGIFSSDRREEGSAQHPPASPVNCNDIPGAFTLQQILENQLELSTYTVHAHTFGGRHEYLTLNATSEYRNGGFNASNVSIILSGVRPLAEGTRDEKQDIFECRPDMSVLTVTSSDTDPTKNKGVSFRYAVIDGKTITSCDFDMNSSPKEAFTQLCKSVLDDCEYQYNQYAAISLQWKNLTQQKVIAAIKKDVHDINESMSSCFTSATSCVQISRDEGPTHEDAHICVVNKTIVSYELHYTSMGDVYDAYYRISPVQ